MAIKISCLRFGCPAQVDCGDSCLLIGTDVDDAVAQQALRFINDYRERTCVQPPLNFNSGSWLSVSPPIEPWTNMDLVREAVRLGWRPPKRRDPAPE